MQSHSIDHNHEPTHALPDGLAVLKDKPLPILLGGTLEFFSWTAIPALLMMTAQLTYDGFAMVAMWVFTLVLSAFLFVTHCWIRHGFLKLQLKSIDDIPDIFESVYSSELPQPFIRWRLFYIGVHCAAFGIGILPGFFIGLIADSIDSELLGILGSIFSALLTVALLFFAQMSLFFGDRLVVFSNIDPKAALKYSFKLGLQYKFSVFMFLFVGGALRIIGSFFCGVGIPLAELLLDTSLTKAYQDARTEIENARPVA